MIRSTVGNLPVLQFENLSAFREIRHFSTTREGGVSSGSYASLNLGGSSGDQQAAVSENRSILCSSLHLDSSHLIFPKQTHTVNVKSITEEFLSFPADLKKNYLAETDALITNVKGLAIMVKTADCVPILLFDSKKLIIAAVHAGWRGTTGGIVSKTVEKMKEDFNCNPEDIFAGIGPSISPEVYEVGPDVWEQFSPEFYQLIDKKEDKRLLNLWKANMGQLIESGIPRKNIELAEICTLSNPSLFFSARRDGAKTGRMATGIMIKGR
jgi:YfiH family protein